MAVSLRETVRAIQGLVVMSPELEAVAFSMYDNQVRLIGFKGAREGKTAQSAILLQSVLQIALSISLRISSRA